MRVGLVSHSGKAYDAIGNQLAEKLAFFLEHGADVRVLLQSGVGCHPSLSGFVEVIGEVAAAGAAWEFLRHADLVIFDYSQYCPLLDFLPLLSSSSRASGDSCDGKRPRLVIDYHGVTPPELWSGPAREALQRGVAMRGLIWCADLAIVHSAYMVEELQGATGFPRERIFQLGLIAKTYREAGVPDRRDDRRWLLFVGRIAGNKRVPILIEALALLRQESPELHAAVVGDHGDAYTVEYKRCRELAKRLGVADRVHFLGQLAEEELSAWYGRATAFVMPSVHEGFCVPIVEAMAHGVPVIGARAAALPETIADAGLTFTPDDAVDLAAQVSQVVAMQTMDVPSAAKDRIAIVCFRFGVDVVGGAERSLRTIALTLRRAGKAVEIFTTCTASEHNWKNELPSGRFVDNGLIIHRFPIDAHERAQHLQSVREIIEANGRVSAEAETRYLQHSIHSSALIDALRQRAVDFDAIITGPYLFGLTADVARAFPRQTLLLPCMHDEPFARLQIWKTLYRDVGGILYHSAEEQTLAEWELGINHPRALEIGTWLSVNEGARAIQADPGSSRDLVYCGRFSEQKEVPRLLDFAARYEAIHPGRFRWVFVGRGDVPLPRAPWLVHRGCVSEEQKREILQHAAALVQLSRRESLSLVVLEAWAEGAPVVVDRRCAVLHGQVQRAAGGRAIENFDEFAQVLDELWENPHLWRRLGENGRAYVMSRYANETAFRERLLKVIASLRMPLAEVMRERGLARSGQFTEAAWRLNFSQFIEDLLESPPRAMRKQVEIESGRPDLTASKGSGRLLVSVRVTNRGSQAVVAEGSARTTLQVAVIDSISGNDAAPRNTVDLPQLLSPGQACTVAVPVTIPAKEGRYVVRLWAADCAGTCSPYPLLLDLEVREGLMASRFTEPALTAVRAALAEAQGLQRLPDDYLDVTLGRFVRLKQWIKTKLLGNFKRGYVDVLSRQQSQVNGKLLLAVQQLADCCAALDDAVRRLAQASNSASECSHPQGNETSPPRLEDSPAGLV